VHQPKLLILDEATTALDPENEAAICETLRKLKGKHTILAISHQPAILKVAERAYRLEGGKASLVPDLIMQSNAEVDITAATA
jgi:ATP-binding cassette subfamily C protein